MVSAIISERLRHYKSQTLEDEEHALKEILQDVALYALSTTNFFQYALFQGGTALRILYQLPRFSEDLDFLLKKPDKKFHWQPYIDQIVKTCELFDIHPEVIDRDKANATIKKLFLKDNSIGKLLELSFQHHAKRKLLIKLEIDINPPRGSHEEIKFLDFPLDYAVHTQDLSSGFSGKCYALLCRPYVKGRDWFDFLWYLARHTPINYDFLQAALYQTGPWQKQSLTITSEWLIAALTKKIESIDWKHAKLDTQRFLGIMHQKTLDLWSAAFFLQKIEMLRDAK